MNFDYSAAIFKGSVPKQFRHIPIKNNTFDLTSIIENFENKAYVNRTNIDNNNYSNVSENINNFIKWTMDVSLPTIATLTKVELQKLNTLIRDFEQTMSLFKVCVQTAISSHEQIAKMPEAANICKICHAILPIGASCLLWEQHEHSMQIKVTQKRRKPKVEKPHNIVQSVLNPSSPVLDDSLPHRYTSYLQDLIVMEKYFFCKRCMFKLPCNRNMLMQHYESKSHMMMYSPQHHTRKFFCMYCNIVIKSYKKWIHHLYNFEPHLDNCYTVNPQKRKSMQEYDCLTCNTVLYSDSETVKKHIFPQVQKPRDKQRNGPKDLPTTLKTAFQSETNVECFLQKLLDEADTVTAKEDKCQEFLEDMGRALRPGFPQAEFHLFGSRMTGLGDRNSDMDVFMDVDSLMYSGGNKQDANSQRRIVDDCVRLLRGKEGKTQFDGVHGVPLARTPIVKVFHAPSKLSCDLSFRHGLSVDNTHFICLCIELQPKLRGLILILKKWSSFLRFRTHITNYALCILAIFYFQQEGFLPSVAEIRKCELRARAPIEGWPTLNFDQINRVLLESKLKSSDDFSILQILIGFFSYYTNYKFHEDVVCPLLGYSVKKSVFKPQLEGMPRDMYPYKNYVMGSVDPEIFRYNSSMCIQDPFELQHNVSKAVPYYCVEKFKYSAQLSANYLQNCKRIN